MVVVISFIEAEGTVLDEFASMRQSPEIHTANRRNYAAADYHSRAFFILVVNGSVYYVSRRSELSRVTGRKITYSGGGEPPLSPAAPACSVSYGADSIR
jgi:hypothetical protein